MGKVSGFVDVPDGCQVIALTLRDGRKLVVATDDKQRYSREDLIAFEVFADAIDRGEEVGKLRHG